MVIPNFLVNAILSACTIFLVAIQSLRTMHCRLKHNLYLKDFAMWVLKVIFSALFFFGALYLYMFYM